MFLDKFKPDAYFKSVHDVTPQFLQSKGIKGIITDLDNTLVPWDVHDATEEIKAWFKEILNHDMKVTIISNNNMERVKTFSDPIQIPFVHSAKKPLRKGFKQGSKQMGLAAHEIAVIGDQLLTDILGGNLGGFYTILVTPIVQTDAKITAFNRKMERFILKRLRRKGKIDF